MSFCHFFGYFYNFNDYEIEKKNYQFEKVSETDFRIRLVESENHGMIPIFFVIN